MEVFHLLAILVKVVAPDDMSTCRGSKSSQIKSSQIKSNHIQVSELVYHTIHLCTLTITPPQTLNAVLEA